jgi:hypothetical protein
MKMLVSTFVLAAVIATTGAFAQDVSKAMTKEDCDKAGGAWNVQGNQCAEESAKMGKEEGSHDSANRGGTPPKETQKVDQPDNREPTTSN